MKRQYLTVVSKRSSEKNLRESSKRKQRMGKQKGVALVNAVIKGLERSDWIRGL